MTFLAERLTELRRHLAHLHELRPRVTGAAALQRDLSLHNDVLFSLLAVCQLVIDVAAEISTRNSLKFEDYTQAVRNLATFPVFPDTVVKELARLPGFRNVLIHEYVALDLERAVQALERLDAVEAFVRIVAGMPDAAAGGFTPRA